MNPYLVDEVCATTVELAATFQVYIYNTGPARLIKRPPEVVTVELPGIPGGPCQLIISQRMARLYTWTCCDWWSPGYLHRLGHCPPRYWNPGRVG